MSPRQNTTGSPPGFFDRSLLADKWTCVYPTKRQTACQIPINKDNCLKAKSLREQILSLGPHDPELRTWLESYAKLCSCLRWHSSKVGRTPEGDDLIGRWLDELRDHHFEGSKQTLEAWLDSPRLSETKSAKEDTLKITLKKVPPAPPKHYPKNVQTRSDTRSSPWAFLPYEKKASSIVNTLCRPLGKSDQGGSIYVFRRISDPNHVKIGYTTRTVAGRLRSWGAECNYVPQLVYQVDHVPHVQRVEQILFAELLPFRRFEAYCKHNRKCPRQHQEWFEINGVTRGGFNLTLENLCRVVDEWTAWMKKAEPYGESGLLSDWWAGFFASTSSGESRRMSTVLLRGPWNLDTVCSTPNAVADTSQALILVPKSSASASCPQPPLQTALSQPKTKRPLTLPGSPTDSTPEPRPKPKHVPIPALLIHIPPLSYPHFGLIGELFQRTQKSCLWAKQLCLREGTKGVKSKMLKGRRGVTDAPLHEIVLRALPHHESTSTQTADFQKQLLRGQVVTNVIHDKCKESAAMQHIGGW